MNSYPIDYHGVDPCEWCATESCDGCMIWEREIRVIESMMLPSSLDGNKDKSYGKKNN